MPKPHVILTMASSLDGRADPQRPMLVSNRLEDERLAELGSTVDAIVTSCERIECDPIKFMSKSVKRPPIIVIVDKMAKTDPKSQILQSPARIMIATSKKAHKSRIKRLEDARKDIIINVFGEYTVNLEDLLWDLGRGGSKRILVEADHNLNMKLLNLDLVDELYVLLAPVIMGSDYCSSFEGQLERRKGLALEGLIQYGDHIVLHYGFVDAKSRTAYQKQ